LESRRRLDRKDLGVDDLFVVRNTATTVFNSNTRKKREQGEISENSYSNIDADDVSQQKSIDEDIIEEEAMSDLNSIS
jgi:hypothetical protein